MNYETIQNILMIIFSLMLIFLGTKLSISFNPKYDKKN